ncbi:MAG: hypothetical protein ACJAWX_003001, partial [Algoriphagus sp.]
ALYFSWGKALRQVKKMESVKINFIKRMDRKWEINFNKTDDE